MASERLTGAACTLDSEALHERLAEWSGLRDRSSAIESLPGGARLVLDEAEPVAHVADLVARESQCCPFYSFSLQIEGPARHLDISAGPAGEPAVLALIGVERGWPE